MYLHQWQDLKTFKGERWVGTGSLPEGAQRLEKATLDFLWQRELRDSDSAKTVGSLCYKHLGDGSSAASKQAYEFFVQLVEKAHGSMTLEEVLRSARKLAGVK
jgi:hypothetical protein